MCLKLSFCHPEPQVKDLKTVQTNVICAHSKRILRYAQNDRKSSLCDMGSSAVLGMTEKNAG